MAQITEMPHGIEPVWIYDVTHQIGIKWFSYKDDVKLLQYALNKIMAKVPLSDVSAKGTVGPMGREYPPLPPLDVDGIFGKKTHATLVQYQKTAVRGDMCLMADGQADPVYKYLSGLGGDPIGQRSITIMSNVTSLTMFKLNKDILKLYGKMMDDAELPPEVQVAVREAARGPRKHWG
jgi:hypothetical protein